MATKVGPRLHIAEAQQVDASDEMKDVALKISTLLINLQFSPRLNDNRSMIEFQRNLLEADFINYAQTHQRGLFNKVRVNVLTLFIENLADTPLIEKYANLLGYTLDCINCSFDHVVLISSQPTTTSAVYDCNLEKLQNTLTAKALAPPTIQETLKGLKMTWHIPQLFLRGIKEITP